MKDITKMTDEERAQYIQDVLNAAVDKDSKLLNESERLQEEINKRKE